MIPSFDRNHRGQQKLLEVIIPKPPTKPRRQRGKVRERRWESRPPTTTHLYVNAFSANPILNWEIDDGAFRTLALIIQKAGGPGVPEFRIESLETYTQSLATLLGRDVRTIRNHLNQLEAAGYLLRWVCETTNKVHIRLSDSLHCRPGASEVPEECKKRVPASWARPRQGKPFRERNPQKTDSAIDQFHNFKDLLARSKSEKTYLAFNHDGQARRQRYAPTVERGGLMAVLERVKSSTKAEALPPPVKTARQIETAAYVIPETVDTTKCRATPASVRTAYRSMMASLDRGTPLPTIIDTALKTAKLPPTAVQRFLDYLHRTY